MSLHVVVGPMFAGKTSEALRVIRMNRSINRRVFVCTHSFDQRYGSGCVTSHDQNTVAAFLTDKLFLLHENADFKTADVVILEEAQFFSTHSLLDFVRYCVDECGKELHVFGLDGDYKQEPMGDILKLCPLADTFRKITALCMFCQDGTPAPFTVNTASMPTTGILVGGSDVYSAVCRRHYMAH